MKITRSFPAALLAAFVISGSGSLAQDIAPGVVWTWRNPVQQGNSLHDIVWTGSHFVTCGRAGTILTSPDGITWTQRDSGTTTFLRKLAAQGMNLVAVGGEITTSHDGGMTWTVRPSEAVNTRQVLRAGAFWVVEGNLEGGQDILLSSPDGIVWTRASGTINGAISDLVWSGTRLVAVGQTKDRQIGFVATSTDGKQWKSESGAEVFGSNSSLEKVVWTGTQFVAVGTRFTTAGPGSQRGLVVTSPDGETWTRKELNDPIFFQSLAWTGTRLVAQGPPHRDLGRWLFYTSLDGVTWTEQQTNQADQNARFLRSGGQGDVIASGNTGVILHSKDHGVTWTVEASQTPNNLNAAIHNGSRWVIVGAEGTIMTSADAVKWTPQSSGPLPTLRGVALHQGQWLAIGRLGELLNSTDGLQWAPWAAGKLTDSTRLYSLIRAGDQWVATGTVAVFTLQDGASWRKNSLPGKAQELRSAAFNGTRLVVVGGNEGPNLETGEIYLSDDGGRFWTPAYQGSSFLRSIIWTGKQFVAVGSAGIIMTSVTGAGGTWSERNAPIGRLNGLAADENLIVAVGAEGAVFTSLDGAAWVRQKTPVDNILYAVIRAGNQWVAAGWDGAILTSPDAITWTARNSGTKHELYGLAWTGKEIIAVGEGGTILASSAVSRALLLVQPSPNRGLTLTGPKGASVLLQRSADLRTWQDWRTLTLGDAPLDLADPDTAPAKFYRAKTP